MATIKAKLPSVATGEAASATPFGRGNIQVLRRGKKGNILVVALNRPKVRNAFHDDMYLDLIDMLHLTAVDKTIAAVVLTGSGPFFSSGADLKSDGGLEKAIEDAENTIGGRQILHKPAGRFMMAMIAYPKVIAAAVQGPAVGIACTLLMHCDLVHMSSKATLWAPFTRLALVPELCSSATFIECMGLSKANEMLLLGKLIDAQTALDWNIASHVEPGPVVQDPFDPASLASKLAKEIEEKLLGLPLGERTSQYFVSFIKGARRQRMESICREELLKLDERFNTGQVKVAASKLQIGSSAREKSAPKRSRL